MAVQGAELNAFLMSNVSTPVFLFGPLVSVILIRVCTASVVERPFLKPNCLRSMQSLSSRNLLRRLLIIFSKSLPGVSSIHRGLYDDGSSKGLSPFLSSTRRAILQVLGKVRSLSHLLYIFNTNSGLLRAKHLRTLFVIPSEPGAAFVFRHLKAVISSSVVKYASTTCWLQESDHTSCSRAGCCGKSPCTIASNLPGMLSPGIGWGFTSFPITSLKGMPRGSCWT